MGRSQDTTDPSKTTGGLLSTTHKTNLRFADKVMPSSPRQSRVQGWFEDAAIRAEFDHAWRAREETRTALRVGQRDRRVWSNLRKPCRKLKYLIQAGLDSYLDARELEGYIQAGWRHERLVRAYQRRLEATGQEDGKRVVFPGREGRALRHADQMKATLRFLAEHAIDRSQPDHCREHHASADSSVTWGRANSGGGKTGAEIHG